MYLGHSACFFLTGTSTAPSVQMSDEATAYVIRPYDIPSYLHTEDEGLQDCEAEESENTGG